GVNKLTMLMRLKYYWHNMYNDIYELVNSCQVCQKGKTGVHHKAQLTSTRVLQFNDELHIDFMGTLPTTHEGYKWIFSMVDSCTNYMELVPLVNADAFNMTKVLLDKWIYKHGVPTTIVSNRGKQFTGAIIKHVSN